MVHIHCLNSATHAIEAPAPFYHFILQILRAAHIQVISLKQSQALSSRNTLVWLWKCSLVHYHDISAREWVENAPVINNWMGPQSTIPSQDSLKAISLERVQGVASSEILNWYTEEVEEKKHFTCELWVVVPMLYKNTQDLKMTMQIK